MIWAGRERRGVVTAYGQHRRRAGSGGRDGGGPPPPGGRHPPPMLRSRGTLSFPHPRPPLVPRVGLLLRRRGFGLGVRAAGQWPAVARLMGVSPVAPSRFNWALGGGLAGLAGVLIGPVTVVNIGTFSFLLVKAVGATLIGGLVS